MSAGPVKTWLYFSNSMGPDDRISWVKFKETMAMVYDSEDHARVAPHKFDSATLEGTVEEYTQSFMSLLGDASTQNTISGQDQVNIYKKGLAPYLKSAVTLNPATGEEIQTLPALLEYGARYDAGVSADVKKYHLAAQKNTEAIVVSPPVVDEPELAMAASNLKRRAETEPPYALRCHKCTGFAHEQAVCPPKTSFTKMATRRGVDNVHG